MDAHTQLHAQDWHMQDRSVYLIVRSDLSLGHFNLMKLIINVAYYDVSKLREIRLWFTVDELPSEYSPYNIQLEDGQALYPLTTTYYYLLLNKKDHTDYTLPIIFKNKTKIE